MDFSTGENKDKFGLPPGTPNAGINSNSVEDQDKFIPPTGKRNADINFNTMED